MKSFSDFGIETHGKQGEINTTCPECSASRKKKTAKCLSVNTEKGLWVCQHCSWSGTLKDGGRKSENLHWNKPAYRKPEQTPKTDLPEKVIAWFKSRGISDEVLRRNQVGFSFVYMPQVEDHVEAISFPYYRGEELINVKWRDFEKNFRQEPGAEQIFYGLNDIDKTTIIVEGEIDKLSFEAAGFKNVVSVPAGAPSEKAKDYSSKFTFLNEPLLEKVKKWIVGVDSDIPGRILEAELARRLGHEICFKVTWPEGCKDANDVLVKHGARALKEIIELAKPYPIEGVFSVADVSGEVDKILEEGWPKGISTGWRTVDQFLTIAPGQLTVITGIPSHGKSELLDALALNLSYEAGWKFAVYSPENHPLEHHISKLIEKFVGAHLGPNLNRSFYDQAKAWIQDHFWFIIPDDTGLDNILILAKVLVRREGISALILDPWNEIDHSRPAGMNETEYISQCLSKIRKFARQNGVHVFLVAHPMKPKKDENGDYPVPTPYDISGSAHFRNKADNCLSVWRDLKSEAKPVELHVQKVRFRWIGKAGMAQLRWDARTTRYIES